MSDTFMAGIDGLLNYRSLPLDQRFPGIYRAIVVETNDPLNMHRIRFKCPEMHDWNLEPNECPWAVSQFALGGQRTGSWESPCIGDWVWIDFEKQHPYGPVWVGFCTPTRRKFYPYPAVYGVTPLPVNSGGIATTAPDDYNSDYLPKDSRPMSHGISDRYGNLDIISAVGFFPVEHKQKPPDPDSDPLQSQTSTDKNGVSTPFKQTTLPPEMNNPDGKFMIRLSKYGHLLLLGDQGYHWQKSDSSNVGEFYGDAEKDEKWEIDRWKYTQRLINEDSPKGVDQRRLMQLTRYGHKIEMRDVGWNRTRDGEYGKSVTISDGKTDERWMKFRTKGGMLFQMSDIGFDAEKDEFVKRNLIDEVGVKTEHENQYWKGDARWIRWVTRHGMKIVLDDRGSSTTNADVDENPHGHGILLKGRRTPGSQGVVSSGDQKGFFWEFNERDELNQTTWGSPLGTAVQINDKLQYFMVGHNREYPTRWLGIRGNEFLEQPLVAQDTEYKSHHLKIDLANEYIRLKTAGGAGAEPHGSIVNPRSHGIQQGLECRDGTLGGDPWTELVDIDDRGLWFSGKDKLTVCRARDGIKIYWWFDEKQKEIVIKNDEFGRIQIACAGNVEILGENVNITANNTISMRAGKRITMQGGGGLFELDDEWVKINKVMRWKKDKPFMPIDPVQPATPASIPKIKPTNRGTRYNKGLEINKDIK